MMDTIKVLFILAVILLLIKPLVEFLLLIWEIIICNVNPVDLKQKYGDWAVVTGSTDGVGKEYAKELAKRNINIVLISRSLEKLSATKNEIETLNPNVQIKIIQADFSKGKEELEKIEVQLQDIPVGILVNNVGKLTAFPMYLNEISKSEIWDIINVNVGAVTLMTRLVIEQMRKRGRGAIVNVSSGSDLMPVPLFAIYAATKSYVKYFSDAIRVEYSKYGLTVQCLSPFFINTKMIAYSGRAEGHPVMMPSAAVYAKNAIKTLGKLDSTTGYWSHELQKFISLLLFPKWLAMKISFLVNRRDRNMYLATQKKKADAL